MEREGNEGTGRGSGKRMKELEERENKEGTGEREGKEGTVEYGR